MCFAFWCFKVPAAAWFVFSAYLATAQRRAHHLYSVCICSLGVGWLLFIPNPTVPVSCLSCDSCVCLVLPAGSLGSRRWSSLAKWRLRELNELPHYIQHRLDASYGAAINYVAQFPSLLVSQVGLKGFSCLGLGLK